MLGAVLQPNHGQCLARPFHPLLLANVRVNRRQLHIFERRGARQQIEALKYESNFLIANGRKLSLV